MNKPRHFSVILILLAVLAVSGLLFYLFVTDLFISSFEKRGSADIKQLRSILMVADEKEPEPPWQRIILNQSSLRDVQIIIIDREFNLLADSRKLYTPLKGQYIDGDVSEAKKKGHTLSLRRDRRSGLFLITVAESVSLPDRNLVISLIYGSREVRRLFQALLVFLLTLGVIMLILILAYARISVLRYRNPLQEFFRLTEAGAGGMGRIIPSSDNSDFLLLAEKFNSLVDRYNQLILSDNRKYSRINTLLAHLKTGMLMVDRETAIVMVNDAAERMLNLNKVRLFKIRDKMRYSNDILDIILEKCRQVNKSLDSLVFSLETPEKMLLELHIDAVFSKYGANEHSGALVILRDVTEMRRLERLKDDFVANVSHELKTPLTIMGGFVETLKSWDNLDAEERDTALNIIDIESQRLKKLINELLELSRIQGDMGAVRRKTVVPRKIVSDVIASLEDRRQEKGIVTRLEQIGNPADLPTVPGWFRQIIVNLYDNALKYTPPEGEVVISLSDEPGEEGRDVLEVKVRDSGMGIPPGDLKRIFERFYRGEKRKNRSISGNGLGLTIARHMAEELGGRIKAESEIGEGSCFTVSLPRIREMS